MAAWPHSLRRLRRTSFVLVALAGSAMAMHAEGQVVLLPAVNTTTGSSEAYALNDGGRVVGQTTESDVGPPRSAAQWSCATLTVLPSLAGSPSGGQQGNVAFGINAHGVAVGMAAWPTPASAFAARPVRWSGGVATDLGGVPGVNITQARAINDAGDIAGAGFGANLTAVRWTPGGTRQTLALLPTHTDSFAWDINSSGRIVGFSGLEEDGTALERRPVYWDGTDVAELTVPAAFNQGNARGINDAGVIVGSSSSFDPDAFAYTAFRATTWTGTAPTLLPLLGGFGFSTAQSINAGGLIIGACYLDADSASIGFGGVPVLWNGGTVADLRPLLASSFAAGATFTVTDINALGQISGYALTDAGTQAFVLTVPAPGAAGILACSGVVAARRRRGTHRAG
ncbi:MAG: hypothetical protein K2Q20_10330 [Phycisphaerales bacterium]|nr:hypothetical protein [Phycisphaerales bacterium]